MIAPMGIEIVKGQTGSAWFGAGGEESSLYRYALHRDVGPQAEWMLPPPRRSLCVCLLNPSTAGADANDPTARKCIHFARAWGFTDLWMVNLFAWRATDPRLVLEMYTEPARWSDPVGPRNDEVVSAIASAADRVVCAWGASGGWARARVKTVLEGFSGLELHALKLSKDGHPWHPLYLPNSTQPFVWNPPTKEAP